MAAMKLEFFSDKYGQLKHYFQATNHNVNSPFSVHTKQ